MPAPLFDHGKSAHQESSEAKAEVDELYRQIGKLKVERDFFSRAFSATGLAERKAWVDEAHPRTESRAPV